MSKHTKAPWSWDDQGYLWGDNPLFEIANGTVYKDADSKLIAASPDLLQACIEASKELPNYKASRDNKVMTILQAAIAKAEGKAS